MCVYVCMCMYMHVYVCERTLVCILMWKTIINSCIFYPEYDLISKLTLYLSRRQVSRVKQGTLTLLEHLVPQLLQGALNCIGCSLT